MLSRVLEPVPADARQDAQAYFDIDHRDINGKFVDDLIVGGPVGPRVVDLGCGPAEIAILLCERSPEIQLMAIDAEAEMLSIANLEIEVAGLIDKIILEQADVTDLVGFDDQMANTVISNSVMHHIEAADQFLREAKRLVAPDGRLFIRDLLRPESDDEVERLVTVHASGDDEFGQQLLRQSFHASFTIDEVQRIAKDLGIAPECVQQTSDRHWTMDWTMGWTGET